MKKTNLKGRLKKTRSYILQADIRQNQDGHWNASAPALPSECSAAGNTRETALDALQIKASEYFKVLVNRGEKLGLREDTAVVEGPAVIVVLDEL